MRRHLRTTPGSPPRETLGRSSLSRSDQLPGHVKVLIRLISGLRHLEIALVPPLAQFAHSFLFFFLCFLRWRA